MEFRLPKKDSSTWRGIMTGAQTFIGAIPVLFVGLWMATKTVPGCNEAVVTFIYNNIVQLAAGFGVSGGAVSFAWNVLFRKEVKNY